MSTSRPIKRVKQVNGDKSDGPSATHTHTHSATDSSLVRKPKGSRIFSPFRVLGLVSNHVPFALSVQAAKGALSGPAVNIISCVGRSWLNWEAGKMNLVFAGSETPTPITSLAVHRNEIFAAAGNQVMRYNRGKQVAVYEPSEVQGEGGANIVKILLMGDQLIGLTEKGITIWSIENVGELFLFTTSDIPTPSGKPN